MKEDKHIENLVRRHYMEILEQGACLQVQVAAEKTKEGLAAA